MNFIRFDSDGGKCPPARLFARMYRDVRGNVSPCAQIRRSPLCAFALCAIGVAVCALSCSPAFATPGNAFGLDAASTARGMAVTAGAAPLSAAGSNPARLIDTKGIEIAAGLVVADDQLRINGEDAGEYECWYYRDGRRILLNGNTDTTTEAEFDEIFEVEV